MTASLYELAEWLCEERVAVAAMEATGVYWRPVWHVLESAGLHQTLVNKDGQDRGLNAIVAGRLHSDAISSRMHAWPLP